ncbi:hypothetical protein D6817_03100 [Candidatus Pacearchaeota archaeon]|nr:MAG: hypothetical protein D6817_03100 [Candidatus Pacearchaeota archaeon]
MGKRKLGVMFALASVVVLAGLVSASYWDLTAREALVLADMNFDGRLNHDDVEYVNKHWRSQIFDERADVNDDGVVNLADRSIVNMLWRTKDFNNDGEVTVMDYLAQSSVCEIVDFGDVNRDGRLNRADVRYVNRLWKAGKYEERADFIYDRQINLADRQFVNFLVHKYGKAGRFCFFRKVVFP